MKEKSTEAGIGNQKYKIWRKISPEMQGKKGNRFKLTLGLVIQLTTLPVSMNP